MSPVIATLLAFATYWLAYRIYARHLAERIFELDEQAVTPAHALNDGVDYVPTRPSMLFGHHYASITGLAPMLGPAIAVIWGWVPAMVWVVLGAVLIEFCVHDFSALVLYASEGTGVGSVAEEIIGKRTASCSCSSSSSVLAWRWAFLFSSSAATACILFRLTPASGSPGMEKPAV